MLIPQHPPLPFCGCDRSRDDRRPAGCLARPARAAALAVAGRPPCRPPERRSLARRGVGIFIGLLAGVAAAVVTGAVEPTSELLGILAGTALLFAAGLVDDVRHLSPLMKLAAQFAAAGIAIAAGLRVELIGNDLLATI